ncbi:MAG TPA: hypothetical protein VJ831_08775 [Jatrophihabitantaceae bacterium]|nr:hypothetical protein [Jatrophihabitantaceae bacterium]
MFVQVIHAKVGDEAVLRSAMDRWQEELMPGATGYLGTTAGIAEDGTFVALARFESAEAARANSERPEQGAWWSEMEKGFAGPVSFHDCDNAQTWLDGGSDRAGFVQVMTGRSEDVTRMHELMSSNADAVREGRQEIIGGLMLDAGDGYFVDAIYFTDEESARAGEQKDMPPEMAQQMQEGMALMGDVTYIDLREPILVSGG